MIAATFLPVAIGLVVALACLVPVWLGYQASLKADARASGHLEEGGRDS